MNPFAGALVAFRYLTILPLPRSRVAGDLGRAAGWFPVVGAGARRRVWPSRRSAVDRVVPPGVGAMLLVALWAVLTGGLHLDGLADACDGLGGGWSRERALAIMRDARSGPYGVTAIVLVLGLKAAALASLPEGLAWRALVLAPAVARAGPLLLAALAGPARPEGAGHAFSTGARWPALAAGWLVAALVSVATLGAWGALALGVTGALAWAWAALSSPSARRVHRRHARRAGRGERGRPAHARGEPRLPGAPLMASTWVYLARHGEVLHAAEGRFFGHTDIALSPVGVAQVAALGESLSGGAHRGGLRERPAAREEPRRRRSRPPEGRASSRCRRCARWPWDAGRD